MGAPASEVSQPALEKQNEDYKTMMDGERRLNLVRKSFQVHSCRETLDSDRVGTYFIGVALWSDNEYLRVMWASIH